MPILIDTHCHLLDESFDADRDEVIARARGVGLTALVVVGETFEENERILAHCAGDPFLLAAAGHYPAHLDERMAEATEALVRQSADRLAAIGEVGVDHRITEDPADHRKQDAILERFASLGGELALPLTVHSRSAGRHAIALLREHATGPVILHAFDGKYGTAIPGVDAGFYFSVPPSIVRSRQKQKLVKNLPLDRLLLESDAPVLGPERDARNEPANAALVIDHVAALKGIDREAVRDAIAANTERLFGPRLR